MNLQQKGGGNGYTNKYGKEYTEVTVPVTQEWKKEFRKVGDGSVRFIATRQEVEDFVESLLKEEREKAYDEGKRYGHDLGINYANQIPDEETKNRIRNAILSEERQFILNILDGIDIADAQMGIVGGTQAIRQALESRTINHE